MAPGNWWAYEVVDSADSKLVKTYTDSVKVDTVRLWENDNWYGQKPNTHWFQRNGKEGLYSLVFDNKSPNGRAYLAWKYPTQKGDTWFISDTVMVEVAGVGETVNVPAGKFDSCIHYRIEYVSQTLGVTSRWSTWRQPGLGTVKTVTTSTLGDQHQSKTEQLCGYHLNR